MDLIYMSDVMAYQSIRNPIYDRYDQRWDQNNAKERTAVQQLNRKREKEPCKICQEKQRRSLMTYIRSKSHEHTDDSCISEQIEEEEEEQAEEQPQQQPAEVQSTNNTNQGQDANSQTMDPKQRSC